MHDNFAYPVSSIRFCLNIVRVYLSTDKIAQALIEVAWFWPFIYLTNFWFHKRSLNIVGKSEQSGYAITQYRKIEWVWVKEWVSEWACNWVSEYDFYFLFTSVKKQIKDKAHYKSHSLQLGLFTANKNVNEWPCLRQNLKYIALSGCTRQVYRDVVKKKNLIWISFRKKKVA